MKNFILRKSLKITLLGHDHSLWENFTVTTGQKRETHEENNNAHRQFATKEPINLVKLTFSMTSLFTLFFIWLYFNYKTVACSLIIWRLPIPKELAISWLWAKLKYRLKNFFLFAVSHWFGSRSCQRANSNTINLLLK